MKKLLIVVVIAIIILFPIGSRKKEPSEWTEYIVQSGDTVCEIAIGITPDGEDYRNIEHYIIEKNNLKNVMIYPGEIILIPVCE